MSTPDTTPLAWLTADLPDQNSLPGPEDTDSDAAESVPYTLLAPPQSNGFDQPLNRPDIRYRFARSMHTYERVLTILRQHYRHEKRARRLSMCGAHATVWHSPSSGETAIRSYHCGLRSCPRCRETHAARTKDKLSRFTATVELHQLSMITLTIRSTSAPLSVQLDNLYKAFKRLRKTPVWTAARPSGYAVLEITRNLDTGLWHPHLHLLARAAYMPIQAVRAAWATCTGGSWQVDIRRVNTAAREKMEAYLSDYLTKPPQENVVDDDAALTEWIDALHGRKVLLRFGRPTLADQAPPQPDPADWLLVGTLQSIIRGAHAGYANARHWLTAISGPGAREHRDPDAGTDYLLQSTVARDPTGVFS